MSLNGASTALVWDKTKQVWQPEKEDGSVVTHVTNSGNGSGTHNTDFWRVTTRDGHGVRVRPQPATRLVIR